MEAILLANGVTAAYLLGLLATVRIIVWTMARSGFKNQDSMCWGSCKSYCDHRVPAKGWDSAAHAFTAGLHAQDWACAWLGAIFWPVVLPVWACWRPVRWFLLHPPKEKPLRLSLTEAVQRAEAELEAARKAQAAAQE